MAWPHDVRRRDLKIDWYSGTGGGGQHRNKHQNCCRMTHLPTGLMATGQTERSRTQNQKQAFLRLADKLAPLMKREAARERYAAGHKRVRNYHEPRNEVRDSRVDDRIWTYERVVNGTDLAEIIDELLKREIEHV